MLCDDAAVSAPDPTRPSVPVDHAPASARASAVGRAGSYAKGVARREEILDRAVEVFADRGVDGTSLRRIAASLGISHSALLHYFSSREELLVAVFERSEERRRSRRPPRESALDTLVRAAETNVDVPGLVQLYSVLVAAALEGGAGVAQEFFTARFARVRAELEMRLREEQAAGRVRADVDPAAIAALLVAASDGLQIQWLLEPTVELRRTLETFAVLLAPQD